MSETYWVDELSADDPESGTHTLMTADEIQQAYPLLGALIEGDGTESLTYTRELWQIKISPSGYDTEDVPD